MSYQARVFVVMPFGVKSLEVAGRTKSGKASVDVDFDRVYNELLAPAIAKAGCQPFRADKEDAAGDIRIDMFFELVTADIVLADISALNANVFYELGIRHGVCSNGVFVVHGGWGFSRPFDVAPDRAFSYDGTLFRKGAPNTADRNRKLAAAVETLSQTLSNAFQHDHETVGSPVYSHLPGLVPTNWEGLYNARAKYFGGLLTDWENRIAVAQAKGYPGDILTLAEDTPTRLHREKLLLAAARSLIGLCRFDIAKNVLADLLSLSPKHLDGRSQLGLVLGRLGETTAAMNQMESLVRDLRDDAEAQGILGRIYKDLWRAGWWDIADLAARQATAVAQSERATAAIHRYYATFERNASSIFNGINALTLRRLLEHLATVTGRAPNMPSGVDVAGLAAVVRFAADAACKRAVAAEDFADEIWSAATLGELAILNDDPSEAASRYAQACNAPGVTAFQKQSMLGQVEMFERLQFHPATTAKAMETIRGSMTDAERQQARFRKVVVFSGHMIDLPGRKPSRFPPAKEDAVRQQVDEVLGRWNIGPGDLTISGAARGGDILFAELCQRRGAHVRLLLPRHEAEYVEESVRLANSNWDDRFFDLRDSCEHWFQDEHLGPPPEGASAHARNNLWVLNTARAEASAGGLYGLLVWDERSTGDGVGGTSHFANEVKRLNGQVKIVNPTAL